MGKVAADWDHTRMTDGDGTRWQGGKATSMHSEVYMSEVSSAWSRDGGQLISGN